MSLLKTLSILPINFDRETLFKYAAFDYGCHFFLQVNKNLHILDPINIVEILISTNIFRTMLSLNIFCEISDNL